MCEMRTVGNALPERGPTASTAPAAPVCGEGGAGWHKASVLDCLLLAAPVGLSPLLILTLYGSERVLVVGGGG